jgi:Rab GDP dissociation inhibitor
MVSSAHNVCPKGYYIAIVSTMAETSANHHLELAAGFERLGRIEEKFMVCYPVASQNNTTDSS